MEEDLETIRQRLVEVATVRYEVEGIIAAMQRPRPAPDPVRVSLQLLRILVRMGDLGGPDDGAP